MEEPEHADPHESMADAAACGLAAALLLLFSILTATGQAQGTVPAQLQLAVVFTFDEKNLPVAGSTATASKDGKPLCSLAVNGELLPGRDYFRVDPARPDLNAAKNLFLNNTALFGTLVGEKPAITFTADRLGEGKPSTPTQRSWATRLSVQFAKKPRDIEVVWAFGPGFAVDTVRAEMVPASAKANDCPPLVETLRLKKRSGVRVVAGASTLTLSDF